MKTPSTTNLFHTPLLLAALALSTITQATEPTQVIQVDFPMGEDGKGGIITADLNLDGHFDFVVTSPGHVAAYNHQGNRMWHLEKDVRVSAGSSESAGLPGHHAPGVQVADVDGDGKAELLFLDQNSRVHIHDAASGKQERVVRVAHPDGAERWEHLVVVNLRGKGDRDLVLQATNAKGYRVGHYIAAYAIDSLDGRPLWKNDHFGALAHGPLRAADLNGDGKDEICGFSILGPDGAPTAWQYPPISQEYAGGASFHIDSLYIEDIRPDVPGLEVALLEEGRNYVALVNFDQGILFWTTNQRQEPQNSAIGQFDPATPGMEIWCRSRYNTHQKPWVLNARGEIISRYELDNVAPPDWAAEGLEVITPIHWTGRKAELAAAKERHTNGDVCIFQPLSGKFVQRFDEHADRLYVADVRGDWREEVIVVNRDQIHIYENPAPNPRPDQPRLWDKQNYRRNKMSWNYYSP